MNQLGLTRVTVVVEVYIVSDLHNTANNQIPENVTIVTHLYICVKRGPRSVGKI